MLYKNNPRQMRKESLSSLLATHADDVIKVTPSRFFQHLTKLDLDFYASLCLVQNFSPLSPLVKRFHGEKRSN
jgi:hypothetical protein